MFSSMFRIAAQGNPQTSVIEKPHAVDIRPSLPAYSLERIAAATREEAYLQEYAELAAVVGVTPPDLAIESFKAALASLNFPIFSLNEVISYMDAKAAKESAQKAGWEWRPLRAKDHREMRFGRACQRPDGNYSPPRLGLPASDYYFGPSHVTSNFYGQQFGNGQHEAHTQKYDKPSGHAVYDRTIPLPAVRRIAAIEKNYAGDVAFFVSDYALLPEVLYPDPFLMAVIPNINVANGTGRFVIDFWDEPGFGIEQMLK